jgi:hypothetical protein
VARFEAETDVAVPPQRAWRALVDWPAHGRWVPLTTVRVLTPRREGIGTRFVGRTAVGPIGFDDPMEVVEWCPPGPGVPGECRVVKQGRVLRGEAWFEVADGPAGGSRVTWVEDVGLPWPRVTRLLDPVLAAIGRAGLRRSLRAMAAEAASGEVGHG